MLTEQTNPNLRYLSLLNQSHDIQQKIPSMRANKSQAVVLLNQIHFVLSQVKSLLSNTASSSVDRTIEPFEVLLSEFSSFVDNFNKSNWFASILRLGTSRKHFKQLQLQLTQIMTQLNLDDSIQVNKRWQLDRAMSVDRARLLSSKHVLKTEVQRTLTQSHRLNQNHQQRLHTQRLQSLCVDFLSALDASVDETDTFLTAQFDGPTRRQVGEQVNRRRDPRLVLNPALLIPFHRLSVDSVMNVSGADNVYHANWEGVSVTVKQYSTLASSDSYMTFIREVKIMSRLNHPSVVRLYGACMEPKACMVMEDLSAGSLTHRLKQPLKTAEVKSFALSIARGLSYIHERKLTHQHLTSHNIYLVNGIPKLTDFGVADADYESIISAKLVHDDFEWMSPEQVCRSTTLGHEVDVYTFGVILWQLVTGKLPYQGVARDQLIPMLKQGFQAAMPTYTPPALQALVRSCVSVDPSKRPKLTEIISQLEAFDPEQSAESRYELGLQHEKQAEKHRREGQKECANRAYTQARHAYEQSATAGFYKAKTNLGMFYYLGLGGLAKDHDTAIELFQQAAECGHQRAQFNLAKIFEQRDDSLSQSYALNYYLQVNEPKAKPRAEALQQRGVEPKALPPSKSSLTLSTAPTFGQSQGFFSSGCQIIDPDKLTFQSELGQGAFGRVYKGTWQGAHVAIKRLHRLSNKQIQMLRQEGKIMALLNSPRIVRFYGVTLKEPFCLVMEYVNGQSLSDFLQGNSNKPTDERLDWDEKIDILLQVATGLVYLHEKSITHRDLRAVNVLINEHREVKLTDFGLSKLRDQRQTIMAPNRNVTGAHHWLSPEAVTQGHQDQKTDVYYFGLLCWEVATDGAIPYANYGADVTRIHQAIKDGEWNEIPKHTPPEFVSLIQSCWAKDPNNRPSSHEVLMRLHDIASNRFQQSFAAYDDVYAVIDHANSLSTQNSTGDVDYEFEHAVKP